MTLIARAVAFAVERHEGQCRRGANPTACTHHLAEVAALVSAFGGTEAAIAAAWLHDSVEDAQTTLDEIDEMFGTEVAGYVSEVTDDPTLSKVEQRREQVASASAKSPMAALIKAADQTSNLRSLVSSPPGWKKDRYDRYVAKARAVVDGLNTPAGLRDAFELAAVAADIGRYPGEESSLDPR